MALDTYANLKTSIANWLNVTSSDLSNVIDDLVTVAEMRIFNDLNVRDQEASISATISSGVVVIPSDYLDSKFFNVVDADDLTREYELNIVTPEYIHDNYPYRTTHARPRFVATEEGNFIFGPYPDATDYVLKGVYKKKLTPISTSANALFTRRPDVYLWAALAESEPILGRDNRIAIWEAKYARIRDLLNRENNKGTGQARPHY